jgi:DNA primase
VPPTSDDALVRIKAAIDIASLIGEYLPLQRSGTKFKALCPFHDDHNPSLEINPDRQTFKCWVCGTGGDIFDFTKLYERVEFPEAIRLLADRAGVPLEATRGGGGGPGKADLLRVMAWASERFRAALKDAATGEEARGYVRRRGLNDAMVEGFELGLAPIERDWLVRQARQAGFGIVDLENAGLISRRQDSPGIVSERFRGRLIFPIADARGRPVAFGGRALPSLDEQRMAQFGEKAVKYLNSPETPLFQKRRMLYGAHLAHAAARREGWVAVMEGYTDVIAAHQVGITNAVATLGTALGKDHVPAIRRLADKVVLVYDGDKAGQSAADSALEVFFEHALDVRVVTLPGGQDPCDFLLTSGSAPFLELVRQAPDPFTFITDRALAKFGLEGGSRGAGEDLERSRQAADWVLSLLSHMPMRQGENTIKVERALDTLGHRLQVPVRDLRKQLRERSDQAQGARRPAKVAPPAAGPQAPPVSPPVKVADLDPIDREIVRLTLDKPEVVAHIFITRIPVSSLRDQTLRDILEACYDAYAAEELPGLEAIGPRLDESRRSVAMALLMPPDPGPEFEGMSLPSVEERVDGVLARWAERDRQDRVREIYLSLAELDPDRDRDEFLQLKRELYQVSSRRPDSSSASAS